MLDRNKRWVPITEIWANKDLLPADLDEIYVRFRNNWNCHYWGGPFVPEGMSAKEEGMPNYQTWSGKLFEKYRPNDERTIYVFLASWIDRLPKSAEIMMDKKEAEKFKAEAEAKRKAPHEPMTFQEMRQKGLVGETLSEGSSASGSKLLADRDELARLRAELEDLRAEREKHAAAADKRRAALEKAREAKAKKAADKKKG